MVRIHKKFIIRDMQAYYATTPKSIKQMANILSLKNLFAVFLLSKYLSSPSFITS